MKALHLTTALLTAAACLTLLAGCGDEEEGAKTLTVTTRDGEVTLRYIDIDEGSGKRVQKGDWIIFNYTGWSDDGTRLPPPTGQGQSKTMRVGFPAEQEKGGLLGWHEGIPGMREGGKRKLFIPAALAYKNQGSPDGNIKPGAKVIYQIEVSAVVNEPVK
jgi:FKBP-type peptidyl-prolyl cis-trans isomerase